MKKFPEYYEKGSGTENVGPLLGSLIRMVRPKNILEIGAGYTSPFIAEALKENKQFDPDVISEHYILEKVINYDPKYVIIDNFKDNPKGFPIPECTEFINKPFQRQSQYLKRKYGTFDFVWFDCGGVWEYEKFIDEYWDLCTEYVLFHYTYHNGEPDASLDAILDNISGEYQQIDLIEPYKNSQGSLTMIKRINPIPTTIHKFEKHFATPIWHIRREPEDKRKIEDIKKWALKLQKKHANDGVTKSNSGGWQFGKFPLYEIPHVDMFKERMRKFPLNFTLINWWININRKGDFNRVHTHPNSDLSLVWYITDNEDTLDFLHPAIHNRDKYFDYFNLPNVITWECFAGDIMVFPADLWHGVRPHKLDSPRISIAMNLKILGDDNSN